MCSSDLEEIAYLGRPHIGSDKLRLVIANMRRYILEHGGAIRYGSKLDDLRIKDGALTAISVNGAWEEASLLVLAVGHSARDTFELLQRRGFLMEA